MSLNRTLNEIMIPVSEITSVSEDEYFRDALMALNQNHWGAVFITGGDKLRGIITDGDVRRIFALNKEPLAQLNSDPVKKYMNPNPTSFSPKTTAFDALLEMNQKMFLCAPVTDENSKLVGIIHFQHLVTEIISELDR